MSNENTISWEAPEFKHYQKSIGWYITLICLIILAIAFFYIIESDIFATVIIGLIGLIIIGFSRQLPKQVKISLNDRGVHFGNLFYPYKQLRYFWVVFNERHQTINFHTTAFVNNILILELGDQNPEEIRKFLVGFIAEHHETEETTIQKIMHKFNF